MKKMIKQKRRCLKWEESGADVVFSSWTCDPSCFTPRCETGREKKQKGQRREPNRLGAAYHRADIRSAPQRQSHLSGGPGETPKAKSPATCQIL